jgi:hypothetical protein
MAKLYKKGQLVIYGSSSIWEQHQRGAGHGSSGRCAKVGKIESAIYSCRTETEAQRAQAGRSSDTTELHDDSKGWAYIYPETIPCDKVADARGTDGTLSKFVIIDPYINDKVEVALKYVYGANLNGILLIKTLHDMNVHISLDQYIELTAMPGVRGGANKNVNKRIKNSRYKKSKKSKRR